MFVEDLTHHISLGQAKQGYRNVIIAVAGVD